MGQLRGTQGEALQFFRKILSAMEERGAQEGRPPGLLLARQQNLPCSWHLPREKGGLLD